MGRRPPFSLISTLTVTLLLAVGCSMSPGDADERPANLGGDGIDDVLDPSYPNDPADPSDPSEPSDPSDPNDSDPNNPSGPGDPSDPSHPSDPDDPTDPEDLCLEGPDKGLPVSGNVYYGTDTPDYLTTMTAAQIKAIGSFDGCSGTLITPQWVLTAEHCGITPGREFCIGDSPGNPNVCFDVIQAIDHPGGADLTVVQLETDATSVTTVEPIRLLQEDLDQSWVGQWAEAAGYGEQETGQSGRREFTDEIIDEVNDDKLVINGQGMSGVCWGDSGGPVMVYDSAGVIRVAGALSWGDQSCVDRDRYTRVDLYYDWIVGHTGAPAPTGPVPCGTVSQAGSCDPSRTAATWCGEDDFLVVETCSGGEVCGFDSTQNGWRCLPPDLDPCQGLGTFGGCNNDGSLSWCTSQGELLTRDCGACGETCALVDDAWGYGCVDIPESGCGDIDYLGICDGDEAVWCNNDGELQTFDCSEQGKTCGYVNDNVGNYCVDAPPEDECGDVDYLGTCDGDTAVWCSNSGELRSEDCSAEGQTCGYVNDNIGYYCVDD